MQRLINRISHKIAVSNDLDEEKEKVIAYGMTALWQMIIIFFLAFSVGFITHTIAECLFIYMTVGFLRKFTGGAHAKSMFGCILVSISSIAVMAVLSRYVMAWYIPYNASGIIICIAFGLSFFIVYKKAPVDSVNKPIKNPEKIKKLRKNSRNFVAFSFIITIVIFMLYLNYNYIWLISISYSIAFAVFWQSLTLTKGFRAISDYCVSVHNKILEYRKED